MEYIVKQFEGRFKHLDRVTLEHMRLQLKCLLKSWGAKGPEDFGDALLTQPEGGLPLWMEVEFLDNIVQFEMECNPFLRMEVIN